MKKGIVALMLLMGLMLLTGCQEETIQPPELLEPSQVHSETVTAYRGEIYQMERYDASVKPYSEALYFEVDGSVDCLYVCAGEYVEAGEVLMKLNQHSLQERAKSLQQEMEYLERDNAYQDALIELDIELLETELRQLQALRADETELALKKNEIAAKKAELRQMRALREPEWNAKEQELKKLTAQMEKCILKAPFSGKVAFMKELPQGERIKAYETVMCIVDESRLTVESQQVSENLLNTADFLYAHIGSERYEVRHLPISSEDYIETTLKGNVPSVQFERVDGKPWDALKAGQYATVYVMRNYVSDAVLIPSQAVLGEANGQYVYVEKNGERVRRMIQTGVMTDALVQVSAGLEEGEMVYVQE